MTEDTRVADLLVAPKARWALAWLAAEPDEQPRPADSFNAADIHLKRTRLHELRDNAAGLLAEVHTRVEDWRYQPARATVDRLGPAEGYARIAAALLTTSAAGWWYESPDRAGQTWICHDPGIYRGHRLPFFTGYGHHWDTTAPAVTVTTSTRLPRLPAAALLADRNLPPDQRPDPASLSAWNVPVKPDARVYDIHSPADWTRLVHRYPSHRTDLCLAPDLIDQWPPQALIWSPDWRAMAQDYDGVHLSVAGWLTATSQILPVPGRDGYTVCEGWPTESTMWFRPVFEPFERLDLGPLQYGYGRPATGADLDLAIEPATAPAPWWRRLLHRPARNGTKAPQAPVPDGSDR